MKYRKRALMGSILALFILIYWGGVVMISKYNILPKAIIEEIASDALGAKVTIGELHMNLEQGTARLGHVQIYNPRKFSDGAAMEIENVDVWIDTWSRGVIKFKEIAASGVQGNLEVQRDRQNFASITHKMETKKPSAEPLDIEKLKIIVDSLTIKNNRLRPRYTLLDKTAKTIAVPDIKMQAIGYAENGVSIKHAIAQVWRQLGPEFEKTAEQAGYLQGLKSGYAPEDDQEDPHHGGGHDDEDRLISE